MRSIWQQVTSNDVTQTETLIDSLNQPALTQEHAAELDKEHSESNEEFLFSDYIGYSPLQLAARLNKEAVFVTLLEVLTKTDSNNEAFKKKLHIVDQLLKASYQNDPMEGCKSIHFAIFKNNVNIVKHHVAIDQLTQKHLPDTLSLLETRGALRCDYNLIAFTMQFNKRNAMDILKLIVTKNNINASCDIFGNSPLVMSIKNRRARRDQTIVNFLLEQSGIDVNQTCGMCVETSALSTAVREGRTEVVIRLLSVPELDINIPVDFKKNVGHLAIENNKPEILKKLLNYGLDQNKTMLHVNGEDDTYPLLTHAVAENKLDMVNILLNDPRVDINASEGLALKTAIEKDFDDITLLLINDGRTHLHFFSCEDISWQNLIDTLCHPSRPRDYNLEFVTPIHTLVKKGKEKILKALLKRRDAPVNLPTLPYSDNDKGLNTALHLASQHHDKKTSDSMYRFLSQDPRTNPSLKNSTDRTAMKERLERDDNSFTAFFIKNK